MWQTKYASAVLINLGLGFDFRPVHVKAISSPGVRSPCFKQFYCQNRKLIKLSQLDGYFTCHITTLFILSRSTLCNLWFSSKSCKIDSRAFCTSFGGFFNEAKNSLQEYFITHFFLLILYNKCQISMYLEQIFYVQNYFM